MKRDLIDIIDFKLPCFDCIYGHSCKYYDNSLWVEYMARYENECPAIKYPYDSIYYAVIEHWQEEKNKDDNGFHDPFEKYR